MNLFWFAIAESSMISSIRVETVTYRPYLYLSMEESMAVFTRVSSLCHEHIRRTLNSVHFNSPRHN